MGRQNLVLLAERLRQRQKKGGCMAQRENQPNPDNEWDEHEKLREGKAKLAVNAAP